VDRLDHAMLGPALAGDTANWWAGCFGPCRAWPSGLGSKPRHGPERALGQYNLVGFVLGELVLGHKCWLRDLTRMVRFTHR
jgi:hypothetical protein